MERPKFNSEKYSTVQFPRHFDVDQNNFIDHLTKEIDHLKSQLKEREELLTEIDVDLAFIEDTVKGEEGDIITKIRAKLNLKN